MSYGFTDAVYSFVLSWEQPQAGLTKTYKLTYYAKKGKNPDVELFDVKTGKLFLKRVTYQLPEEELFIGNQITVFARQMTIQSFGDRKTEERFSTMNLMIVVPFDPSLVAYVLKQVAEDQLQTKLEDVKMVSLSRTDATRLATLSLAPEMAPILQSPALLCLNVRALAGTHLSQEQFEQTLLAPNLRGNVWIPNFQQHEKALAMAFNPAKALESCKKTTARMDERGCSVCVIKAHAVQSGHVAEVVTEIVGAELAITAMRSVSLSRVDAQEFLEVYKGVVPNFPQLVDELSRSRVVAIEVSGERAVQRMRELAGPIDFSIAKRIRPKSIRARFGKDSVQNCVHVTDLEEDGVLESEYMFDILP